MLGGDLLGDGLVVAGHQVGVAGEADPVGVFPPGFLLAGESGVLAGEEAGLEAVDLGPLRVPDRAVADVDGALEAFLEVGAGIAEDGGGPRVHREQDDGEGVDEAVADGQRPGEDGGDPVEGVPVAAGGDDQPARHGESGVSSSAMSALTASRAALRASASTPAGRSQAA